ncbi:MAG: hypothetical protein F6K22_38185, partial [Okeania sp. SIO2F4]|nr:hypothetical protein [Okeania sp. SIO2F4]
MKITTTLSKLLTVTGGLIVVAGASGNAHAATLGVELVQNGNAETNQI